MRVSHIRYMPIEGGTLGGHFALHVILGASNDPECSSLDENDLATLIHDAFEKLNLSHGNIQGVLFDVRRADDLDSNEMLSLLGTLRDWNIHIIAWVNERKRYPWFEQLGYLTVFVESVNWPNFKVNEIRVEPEMLEWVEPAIYEVNANATSYLQPSLGLDAMKVLTFIKNARRNWGVIMPRGSAPVPPIEFTL